MAIHEHANEQTNDSQCHQSYYHQLYVSYVSLFLLSLKQVDVTCHICRMQLQRFSLGNEQKTILQFRSTKGMLPIAHLLIDADTQLCGRQGHIDRVAPGKGCLIVLAYETMTDHYLLEIGSIELVGQMVADAVILHEITLKSLVVNHFIGDDTTIAKHTTVVHRVLEHLLGQAVETRHRLSGTDKTKRLC